LRGSSTAWSGAIGAPTIARKRKLKSRLRLERIKDMKVVAREMKAMEKRIKVRGRWTKVVGMCAIEEEC